jgi:hypothetical protein
MWQMPRLHRVLRAVGGGGGGSGGGAGGQANNPELRGSSHMAACLVEQLYAPQPYLLAVLLIPALVGPLMKTVVLVRLA